jgi:hypothetical protein
MNGRLLFACDDLYRAFYAARRLTVEDAESVFRPESGEGRDLEQINELLDLSQHSVHDRYDP